MSGDLSVGGGVYIYIPSGIIDYWPVEGVTQPQHYWPFSETGDYTDQGSTGELDLTEQGSGNSFSSDGLVLNGSGWATGSNNADVSNLGATFSILCEVYLDVLQTQFPFSNSGMYIEPHYNGAMFYAHGGGHLFLRSINPEDTPNDAYKGNTLPAITWSQCIWVQSSGSTKMYINGSEITPLSGTVPLPTPTASTCVFTVGAANGAGGYGVDGTIRRVAVLKGTAWSADDVAAIYESLP